MVAQTHKSRHLKRELVQLRQRIAHPDTRRLRLRHRATKPDGVGRYPRNALVNRLRFTGCGGIGWTTSETGISVTACACSAACSAS
jgi:hypothetical protein